MKPNNIKCIWLACIAAVAVCTTMTTVYATPPQDNIGTAYISSVVGVNGECAVNTQDGNSGDYKWDVQAGGTYMVTLTGATDCDLGQDTQIGIIVHNGCGTNIYVLANYVADGVYRFQVTIPSGTQCGCTMPIEYCTASGTGIPANLPGTGFKAQEFDGTGGNGKVGHLRVSTFDGSCNVSNPLCGGTATPTPTPCTGSITACKYYDFNANGAKDTGEALLAWPFCITSLTDPSFAPVPTTSSDGSCVTVSNLPLGTYAVTEGSATGYTTTTVVSNITISQCDQNRQVDFGNYCTIPSGGLTLGFWSNRNGQAVLQAHDPAWRTLLNGLHLVNASGNPYTVPSGSFTTAYASFRTWILGATATNMAYMLSAQLAALELDVAYKGVLSTSFDLCSGVTINQLMTNATNSLLAHPYTPSGNVDRPGQESMKNCIDAINNNGQVIPAAPCDHSSASVACGQ